MRSKLIWIATGKSRYYFYRYFLRYSYRSIPTFLKPVLIIIHKAYDEIHRILLIISGPQTHEEINEYWKEFPWDESHLTTADNRAIFVKDIIKRYVDPSANILEIGCGPGRNLHGLFNSGFQNLAGIEINKKALRLLEVNFPEMAERAKLYGEAAEKALVKMPSEEYVLVFTIAVLQHIHPSSHFIFNEIARITGRYLITIEIEKLKAWSTFPRNYRILFESLGFKQIEKIDCSGVAGLGKVHTARVFEKDGGPNRLVKNP